MYLTADFGEDFAGLGTVGYTLIDGAGGDAQARTTTGVVDLGDGAYGVEVDVASVASTTRLVKWDTGGGTPIFAHEDLGPPKSVETWGYLGMDPDNPGIRVKIDSDSSTVDGDDVSQTVEESPADTVTVTRI